MFIECLIIIPHRLVGESREICEKLNDLTGPSEPGRGIGSPGAEGGGDKETRGIEERETMA